MIACIDVYSKIAFPDCDSRRVDPFCAKDSEVQVTGEYLTNYLKEMDGDDSQFKDWHWKQADTESEKSCENTDFQ